MRNNISCQAKLSFPHHRAVLGLKKQNKKRRLTNRALRTNEGVEEAALAHIWPADDGNA